MNKSKEKLIELRNLATLSFRRKHSIVLDPRDEKMIGEDLHENIEYDKAEWEIQNKKLLNFIDTIKSNKELNHEEKMLAIYEKICREYVYDDNLISYIQKMDDDSFGVPDWYGRDIGQEWKDNREEHNRRICFELSRYLAQGLKEVYSDRENVDICILYDKGLTHYFVGLSSDDYSITLDVDDFNNIKDLTRIKSGLTAKGIVVLKDEKSKVKDALQKFNENRCEDSITMIESEISGVNRKEDVNEGTAVQLEESDDITFIRNAMEILKEEHGIDSQGMFEYIKEIVDIKMGPEYRKKVWKKIQSKEDGKPPRHIRCLVLNVNGQEHLIDVDKNEIRNFNPKELEGEDSEFIDYKKLKNDWEKKYNGR